MISDDIVISGIGGRFPESDSTDEFAYNLYNKVNLISGENRRWPSDLYGMDSHMGQLKEIDKLDIRFFGIMDQLSHYIEPQSRILLETTYEAIIDAGVNPQSLRGTRTGVYIGCSTFGTADGVPEETQPDSQTTLTDSILWLQGGGFCLFANRVSYMFDFKGPSLVTETACSASLVALNIAMNDMRLGRCEQAIVGGTHINLQPFSNHMFQSVRLNPSDGIPKVWDEKADGFVRGETVASLFLQRKSNAKRIYATVLNTGVNIDGHKRMGMFFPSSEAQEELMIQVYEEANVDPLKLNYFEAHATGTKVGDTHEAKAIYNAYCVKPGRKEPLQVGLLKSVIGHAEGASGVSSIAKVLIAYENECIPGNKNLNHMKSTIADMCPPLAPIRDNIKYTPGIAGVNNIGVGGVNANVLLEPNYKTESANSLLIADTIPRLINICCRTEQAFNQMCKWIEENPNKISRDFLALLTDTMKYKAVINSAGFPYRGSVIMKKMNSNNTEIKYEFKKQFSFFTDKSVRPLWFLFTGLGGQWSGMAKSLMPIKFFADRIANCCEVLKPFGIDLKHLLLSDDKNSMSTMTNKFCATTAIEIALFDVMKALDIIPDGIIGHSFGEIAAAYADGCLTAKEALLVSYIRGKITESDKRIPKGLMAVVGLSWKEAKQLCPKGVSVVCNNAKDTVVVSGTLYEMQTLIKTLSEKGIFVRQLDSNGIPYHSEHLSCCAKLMREEIKKLLPNPKLISKKWTSTAVLESDPIEELKYASAEYFVHNLISPVYFYNRLRYMPLDAIVVEVGPHALFAKIITQTIESSTYLSLIKKDSNDTNLDMFLGSIARLYELGMNPTIENLYPKVEWPVARGTQSISSLMRWEHNTSLMVRTYPDFKFRESASDLNECIDLEHSLKNFLPDHKIEGNIIFPATGYLMLAWKRLAFSVGRIWNQIPVVFEDVQFRRAVFLSYEEPTRLKVRYLRQSGEFFILENNITLCTGRMHTTDDYTLHVQDLVSDEETVDEDEMTIDANDIYKDLRVCGYDYGFCFKRLRNVKTKDFKTITGKAEWMGNWVTFVDSLLQTMALGLPFRKMMVPVMIKSLRCDPKVLYEGIAKYKVDKQVLNQWNTFEDNKANEWEAHDVNDEDASDLLRSENIQYLDQINAIKFHNYKSVLPFHVDMTSRMIVTHGIEVEDLMALPIPRKSNIQDLKLESYRFVANEDSNAIEESDKNRIKEYLKVCSSLAKRIKNSYSNSDYINKTENNLINDLNKKYMNDMKDNQIMLKMLNNLDKCLIDTNNNNNNNSVKANIDKMMAQMKNDVNFDLSKDLINQVSINEHLIRTLIDIVNENNVPKRDIKVLEINLTNDLLGLEVDNHLASAAIYPIDVDYTIAVTTVGDISEDYRNKSIKFCEWNPKKTNFPTDIVIKDLIIMRDSQDLWELDLDSYLQEVYDVIVDRGFLLCVFRYKLTEPELALNSMNGRKQLNDSDLEHRINGFKRYAKTNGFNLVASKSDCICNMAVLFRKVYMKPNRPLASDIIEIKTKTYEWFQTLKEKLLETKGKDQNIWLIANDSPINGIVGFINCLRLEPGGEKIRCIFNCNKPIELPVNFDEKPFSVILANDLVINVLRNGKIGTYRHLTLPKDYDQIETNEYFLNTGHNRDLSSLQWFDLRQIGRKTEGFDFDNKKVNYVDCNIYSSGLNFKDVMFATGRITSGPLALFTDCLIGFEFAGRRTDTGERICGFDISRCFATSVDTSDNMISPIPDHWSMDDAVTVLSTYSTVWYGLLERGHLQRGESILIHSGAGGVGQAAINVCKYYDCDIYVTVGTDDKKKFLMTEYNIPENRIFSSRDIQFKYRIKALTKGKGVDLVLNSLTGDKLEASYECVADCGRFVEIGKYDLQLNKQLGMFSFLRDISFIGISVDRKLFLSPTFIKKWWHWMHTNSNNGMIKPINKTIFKAEEAEKAFRYMTTGKHIGKIVLKIREEENKKIVKNGFNPSPTLRTTVKTYFDSNKVYIITGGLGGFGLELIHWMITLGARKLVLTSRYGVKTDYQKYILGRIDSMSENFKMFGTEIIVSTDDCNQTEGAKHMIKKAEQLGPIGGVFHLTLVLNDCLLENQTIDKFCETIDSKAKAFINLDELTRKANIDLDYFVVFSSIVCGKGNAGQSNYGYANSVCERVCESRRRDGLHGLAIQWGPIGDVGVIADSEINPLSGFVKQRINSCLDILDKFLQTSNSVISCYLRAQRLLQSGTKEAKIVAQIWALLGVDPKTTPDNLSLGEIGMESMFATELQQGLERDYNIKVPLSDMKFITVKLLKDFEAGKIQELKKYSEELKISRNKLSKYKFIIPSVAYTPLNAVKAGKPIFYLPPIDGLFASLEPLAAKCKRPVIGLNWTKELDEMNTMKEISKYYMNLLKTLSPNENYDLLGPLDNGGAIIVKLLPKAPINKAVIIDCISDLQLDDRIFCDEDYLEMSLKSFWKTLPKFFQEKFTRDLRSNTDFDAKVAKYTADIREFGGKSLVSKDLDEILKNSIKRAKMLTIYRQNTKKKFNQFKHKIGKKFLRMTGKLLLIKSSERIYDKELDNRFRDIYFLPKQEIEDKLNLEDMDENVEEFCSDTVAEKINNFFN